MSDAGQTLRLGDGVVERGERRTVDIPISENFSGSSVSIVADVWRASEPGPTLLAVHYANQAQVLGRLGRLSEAAEIETKRLALVERQGGQR